MAPSSPQKRTSWFVLFGAIALAGCQPDIGDPCTLATDCSTRGTRLCEPDFPGGYCTIFNCRPNKCPEEALCIAYGSSLSTEPLCANPASSRLQRSFCMFACNSDSDCRTEDGYRCVNLEDVTENPWGAVSLDSDSRHKICTVPASSGPRVGESETAVCNPNTDASFPPEPDGAPPTPVTDGASEAATDAGRTDAGVPDASLDAAPDAVSSQDAAPDVKDAQGGS